MNTKANTTTSDKLDNIKWISIVLLLGVSMFGFYYFKEYSLLLRVIVLLATVGIIVFIALQTVKGRDTWQFVRSSHLEVRKVVWPTRQETIQTTAIVLVMVVLVALLIWLIDSVLLRLVRILTGEGG